MKESRLRGREDGEGDKIKLLFPATCSNYPGLAPGIFLSSMEFWVGLMTESGAKFILARFLGSPNMEASHRLQNAL